MKTKVLIVGSNGFIGSNLVKYLKSKESYVVYEADIHQEYHKKNYYIINAFQPDFNSLFSDISFDYCINCSGAANVNDSLIHPLRDFQLNSSLVIFLLEAIRLHNNKCGFLNLSSAAVYGNPVSLPVKESSVCFPVSPYGQHKYYAELICAEYKQFFGLNTCSLRIFSAFGEGLKKQLFWDFYTKSKMDANISLFGNGTETRDFIYIKDLVRAIELVLRTRASFQFSSINIANGLETTVKSALETFSKVLGINMDRLMFKGEARASDPVNWLADITILKSLGYRPEFSLFDGLNNYCKWLKDIENE